MSPTPPDTPVEKTPYDRLKEQFPDAPSAAQVEAMKAQVPNGNLALWITPDEKRYFLLRGITGLEMREIQGKVPPNTPQELLDYEYKLQCISHAVVHTNVTRNNRLGADELRLMTAGLPDSLYVLVENLSDYHPPAQLLNTALYL